MFAKADDVRSATARARVAAIAALAPQGPWLDVGCSTGALLRAAVERGIDAEGIELSAVAVAEARARGLRATQVAADDFTPERRYACITAFDLVEHLIDPNPFLARVRSWLAPGGRLAITVPDIKSAQARLMRRHWYYYAPPVHVNYFDRDTIVRLLGAARLAAVQIGGAPKVMTLDYVLQSLAAFNPLLHRGVSVLGHVDPGGSAQAAAARAGRRAADRGLGLTARSLPRRATLAGRSCASTVVTACLAVTQPACDRAGSAPDPDPTPAASVRAEGAAESLLGAVTPGGALGVARWASTQVLTQSVTLDTAPAPGFVQVHVPAAGATLEGSFGINPDRLPGTAERPVPLRGGGGDGTRLRRRAACASSCSRRSSTRRASAADRNVAPDERRPRRRSPARSCCSRSRCRPRNLADDPRTSRAGPSHASCRAPPRRRPRRPPRPDAQAAGVAGGRHAQERGDADQVAARGRPGSRC